ncbi:MAG TPA: tRNA(Ile)(2)-agmatinylcytidine synthase [Thermoplasmata archaeon]|nr:tRNA(Ile)(2)-agmatinylcytidine synthase [Thermoplasmata archaeon]
MVLWVGVDDTDSLRGMCTTFLATEIVREVTRTHDLIGYPRLVRLNPNIPWKTRGNGALALRFGRGTGKPATVGQIAGRAIRAFPRSRGSEDPEVLRKPVEDLVRQWSVFGDPTTNPAFAILRRPPAPSFYWHAVRRVVSRREARLAATDLGILRGFKNGRGIIGATAALAWRPRDRTYEILAYRHPSLWGLTRDIDPVSVREMDRRFPSTFNNYDYVNEKVVLAPHSPCPILFGIRGDVPSQLPRAMRTLRGETPERWLLFETNQGTDDHVVMGDWALRPFTASVLEGKVVSTPVTRPGGHVLFEVDGRRRVTVAAYEPSKQFREVVRALRAGDIVRVTGSVREEPRTLNLERLEVVSLVDSWRKVSNPRCPSCGKSMKSIGSEQGFRCVRGHARLPREAVVVVSEARTITVALYEPPACARRHLAKPIQRILGNRFGRGPTRARSISMPPPRLQPSSATGRSESHGREGA